MPNTTVPAAGEAMPAAINLTLNPHDRLQLSTTIEQLINMLDDLDPDADLEPDEDGEPWLGWPNGRGLASSQESFERMGGTGPLNDDRESDDSDAEATALENRGGGFRYSGPDDSEANGDDEPSLGGMGTYCDGGLQYDLELDTADAEPSLAATEAFDHDHAWHVSDDQWNIEDGEQDAGDAPEFDHADYDHPGVIWGGGSDESGRVPA